jgi:hypothetical protein
MYVCSSIAKCISRRGANGLKVHPRVAKMPRCDLSDDSQLLFPTFKDPMLLFGTRKALEYTGGSAVSVTELGEGGMDLSQMVGCLESGAVYLEHS